MKKCAAIVLALFAGYFVLIHATEPKVWFWGQGNRAEYYVKKLSHPNVDHRLYAVSQLQCLDDSIATTGLIDALDDPNSQVRDNAALALHWKKKRPSAEIQSIRGALVAKRNSYDDNFKRQAEYTLAHLAP